jgi:hypothetical protein
LFCWQLQPASANSYATNFAVAQNPLSENGAWINGSDVGLDWNNVQITGGHASGTQPFPDYVSYDDSTAVLAGNWGPDQVVQATVVSGDTYSSNGEEVELRLCSSISAHQITGYELNFQNYPNGGYCQIVRWNGPLGDFTYLASQNSDYQGIKSGDVISGTISGGLISVYVNGILVCQATDQTYTNGSPGVGFYLYGANADTQTNFGLTAFSANDGGSPVPTPTPTPSPTPSPMPTSTPTPTPRWHHHHF